MAKETKIGLLVGLAFIILFGIILSEKGTGRTDQLTTPPIAAYKPIVIVPSSNPPSPQLSRENKDDVADRLTMTESGVKLTDQAVQTPANNNVIKTPETIAPAPVEANNPEIAPKLKPLLPAAPTKSLTQQIPAANPSPSGADLLTVMTKSPVIEEVKTIAADPVKVAAEPAVVAAKTHTVQKGETLASICRQYYPGQAYQMLKKVIEFNKFSQPQKLMCGQVVKLPQAPTAPPAESTPLVDTSLLVPVDNPNLPVLSQPNMPKVSLVPEDKSVKAKTVALAKPKAKVENKTYVVQSNDTLTRIARRVYGDERAWTRIYEYNKKFIADPKNLKSGQTLRMPPKPANQELAAGPKVD